MVFQWMDHFGQQQPLNTMTPTFKEFPKMARLSRECVVTEKIDGTNASVFIMPLTDQDPTPANAITIAGGVAIMAGSRTRWITPEDDNYGFAAWVRDNADELRKLGPGHHFGEWWGRGIQRNYGLNERRFSLFNVGRWHQQGEVARLIQTGDPRIARETTTAPACCHVVPILWRGIFETEMIDIALAELASLGSIAEPGFMKPEGVVVYHAAAGIGFKKTIEKDHAPKSLA
jgi:hypothetical protein